MNTNWSKILLFTLLGFALGHIVTYLAMGRHGHGHGDCCGAEMSCGGEMSCHGDMAACGHHGDMGGHGGKMMGACCSGHGMGHGDANVKVIVADLEKANFQGDTVITIDGGTVNVSRTGDSTMVRVEMKEEMKEEVHEHAH